MVQRTFDEFTKRKPLEKTIETIAGKEILVEKGVFWIQKQRQLHSMHHISPYQASFPPQIPAYFIEYYSEPGDIIFDPFCGRGTVILEANLRKRIGIGIDVSPLAVQLAKAKLKKVTFEEVKKRLEELDFSAERLEGYEKFKDIYHPYTFSQLINIREQLTDSPLDTFIKAIILGRLHGHSPAFFSVFTFNVISPSPEAIKKQNIKHGSQPEKRDIVPRILKKAKTVLRDTIREESKSWVKIADSRKLPLKNNSVDFIVTSPPFLSVVNYIDDNWLRFWFLGYEEKDLDELRKTLIQTPNLDVYKTFIDQSIDEMERVLKRGKHCIIEVGDIAHKSKKLNLDELIVELVDGKGFKVEEILVNYISSPKISKAFSENSKKNGTKTNRCVIMQKK